MGRRESRTLTSCSPCKCVCTDTCSRPHVHGRLYCTRQRTESHFNQTWHFRFLDASVHWTSTLLSYTSILNDWASNPMAHSVWLSSRQRGNDIQCPTVVSDMACCALSAMDSYSQRIHRGQQTSDVSHELLASEPCSTMPVITCCGRRSVADKWKPHWTTINTVLSSFCAFQRTPPDTESRSAAGHKAHSLVPITPPTLHGIRSWFSEFFR